MWSLEYFIQEHAYRWTGLEGEEQYFEVDQRRGTLKLGTPPGVKGEKKAQNGNKSKGNAGEYRASTGEKFGRELREKYWNFEEGWVNLNHGERLSLSLVAVHRTDHSHTFKAPMDPLLALSSTISFDYGKRSIKLPIVLCDSNTRLNSSSSGLASLSS